MKCGCSEVDARRGDCGDFLYGVLHAIEVMLPQEEPMLFHQRIYSAHSAQLPNTIFRRELVRIFSRAHGNCSTVNKVSKLASTKLVLVSR